MHTVLPGANPDLLFFCDHASNHIPAELEGLGVGDQDLQRHIAWDIGAEAVTRHLAAHFAATALIAGVSRLVIDLNRAPGQDGLVPEVSDHTPIPGNRGADVTARLATYHSPYHDTLSDLLDARPATFAVSIHSFTPHPRGGERRTLDLGLLAKRGEHGGDWDSAESFLAHLPGTWETAINAPYSAYDLNYTVDRHVVPRALRHLGIEIRQDHIASQAGARAFAAHIARALEMIL